MSIIDAAFAPQNLRSAVVFFRSGGTRVDEKWIRIDFRPILGDRVTLLAESRGGDRCDAELSAKRGVADLVQELGFAYPWRLDGISARAKEAVDIVGTEKVRYFVTTASIAMKVPSASRLLISFVQEVHDPETRVDYIRLESRPGWFQKPKYFSIRHGD